uniref:Major facilitator superfamily (MFS) profile domain-containing protein n=1 Tax=Panagrolaimus superbus TaxID=310955 RepID=A0A914Y7A0_9BILA
MQHEPLKNNFQQPQCHRIVTGNETLSANSGYKGTFTWSVEDQSLLFSAGFYGNLIIMAFAGFLINHFGAKKVALISAIGMTATTALMPTAAYLGFYYFFVLRILFGIFEASF